MISLGIDAAWTEKNPSGVALLSELETGNWELLRVSRSYEEFISGDFSWSEKARGSIPEAGELLKVCSALVGEPDCVSIDMPIASFPITGRRACDNGISSHFGGKGASTHSPTPERPGRIASQMYTEFHSKGYEWRNIGAVEKKKSLLEVYPHTAIIRYLELDYRYEYKVEKRGSYKAWATLTPEERLRKLIRNLNHLSTSLKLRVSNIHEFIPVLEEETKYPTFYLKSVEDMLDAVVCAMVGMDYLNGRVEGYGAADGTIWVPTGKKMGEKTVERKAMEQKTVKQKTAEQKNRTQEQLIESTIETFYQVISGKSEENRDWDMFRSLFFSPDSGLASMRFNEKKECITKRSDVETYIVGLEKFLKENDFYEWGKNYKICIAGNMANVDSEYFAKRNPSDEQIIKKGVNFVQLIQQGEDWKIHSMLWQDL